MTQSPADTPYIYRINFKIKRSRCERVVSEECELVHFAEFIHEVWILADWAVCYCQSSNYMAGSTVLLSTAFSADGRITITKDHV